MPSLNPDISPAFFTQHKTTYPVSDGAARTEGKALGNGGGEAAHHPTACDFRRRKKGGVSERNLARMTEGERRDRMGDWKVRGKSKVRTLLGLVRGRGGGAVVVTNVVEG